MNTSDLNDALSSIKELEARLDALPAPAPAPTPNPQPPPIYVPPAPGPLPPPPMNNYARTLLPRAGDYWLRIDNHDTLVDLQGSTFENLVIDVAPGLRSVGVINGSLRAINCMRNANDTSNIDRMALSDLTLNNPSGSTIMFHGNNLTLHNVEAHARDYCLYHGGTSLSNVARLTNCNFISQGPEATARFTSVSGLGIQSSVFTNGSKHALRVHGTASGITLDGVSLTGAGNGLCIGAMGVQVPASIADVIIRNSRINVNGPDRLNLARDGSLRRLRIESLAVRSPAGWLLTPEYQNNYPVDWNVTGLVELV